MTNINETHKRHYCTMNYGTIVPLLYSMTGVGGGIGVVPCASPYPNDQGRGRDRGGALCLPFLEKGGHRRVRDRGGALRLPLPRVGGGIGSMAFRILRTRCGVYTRTCDLEGYRVCKSYTRTYTHTPFGVCV